MGDVTKVTGLEPVLADGGLTPADAFESERVY